MPISVGAQNQLQVALKNAAARAEICDAIDASTTLLDVTAGTLTASKAVVVDASSKIDTLDITLPKIGGTEITATAAELNRLDGAAAGDGTVASVTGLSAVEAGAGTVHKTVITANITASDSVLSVVKENGAGYASIKLYDFPVGRILILGVTCDLALNVSDSTGIAANAEGDLALGTTATADSTLDGTDVDLLPSTAFTCSGNVASVSGALAASAQFDGTSTAKDARLNLQFDAVSEGQTYMALTGTVTITWINLGDY